MAPKLPLALAAQRALALKLLALPTSLLARAAPPAERRGERVDAQTSVLLLLEARLGGKRLHEASVAEARAGLERNAAALAAVPPPIGATLDLAVRGGDGGRLDARLYLPASSKKPLPLLVYFHGGGFALGSIASHDVPCQLLCAMADCAVLSVAYRLAPEHPFPAAREDALASYDDALARADELGVDASRVAVGGDSAGGNLAALVALARREAPTAPRLQLLIYPALDLTMSSPSIDEYDRGFILERASMVWYLDRYAPDASVRSAPEASPLFEERLAGVAPAHVQTAGFDPLRDDGERYVAKLRAAGVAVEHKHYPGLVHGYLHTTAAIDAARPSYHDAARALRAAFRSAGPGATRR